MELSVKTLTVALLGVALSGPAWAGCNNADFAKKTYSNRTTQRQFQFEYKRSNEWRRCNSKITAYHQPYLTAQCVINGSWRAVGDYFRVNGKDSKGRCIVKTSSNWRPSAVSKARWDRKKKLFVVWYKNGDVLRGVER